MKKRFLFILTILALATASLSAQDNRRGVALGVDRDSLLWLIGSPFDNWHLTVGGGIQTFMGNELEASARHNKLNYNIRAQIGKWLIPDLAVSLRFSYFDVDGQSLYGLQPFINKFSDTPNENGYYPFHAHAISMMGFVTLDWTNLIRGYENGKRTRTHIYTPIGFGMSMLFGPQRNPRGATEEIPLGAIRRNFELAYDAAIGVSYTLKPEVTLVLEAEMFGSESTWDWSPYNNAQTIFDLMPTLSAGVRVNLLSHVNKVSPYDGGVFKDSAIHYFRTVGSQHELDRNRDMRDLLARERDSLMNLLDEGLADRQKLLDDIDSVQDLLQNMAPAANVMEELSDANAELNLPAAIVYYELDRWVIDYNGRKRLENFVKEIKQLPDTLEFYIVGAADSLTGSIRHNQWLSEKRSNAAFDMMVKQFGADPNQFILVPVGGIVDYEPKEYNRMAMVILRTEETEAIIRRWVYLRERR